MEVETGYYGKVWGVLHKVKPYLTIIALQFGYAGMFIISMVSLKHGMSHFILVVYRHAIATAVIAPFAFVLERKIRPKMTLPIFLQLIAMGFLEPVLDQNLYYLGMKYTSASFASAAVNVLPAATFIMAIIFRLERVRIKSMSSQAKVIGTILTVAGAVVMTLYKGPVLDFIRLGGLHRHGGTTGASSDQHWLSGTLMLLASACSWAGFFIIQSFTLKKYPAELSLTCLICLMGTVQASALALVMEHDRSAWVIGWDNRLLASAYSGVVCSGIAYYVQGMVSRERGPVFVTAFAPLGMIITAALGVIVLSEQLHLGSIIGALVIVIGLYSVVWGKSKDPSSSSLPAIIDPKTGTNELPIINTAVKSSKIDDNIIGNSFTGGSKIPPSQD